MVFCSGGWTGGDGAAGVEADCSGGVGCGEVGGSDYAGGWGEGWEVR